MYHVLWKMPQWERDCTYWRGRAFLSVFCLPRSPCGIVQKAAQAQAPPGGVLLVVSVPGILEHSLCQLMWLTHRVVFHPGLVVFFFLKILYTCTETYCKTGSCPRNSVNR